MKNLKVRSLALFQFFSFLAITSLLTSMVLLAYEMIISDPTASIKNLSQWETALLKALEFMHSEVTGIFASITFYISMGLFVSSWIVGWLMFRIKTRNIFDSLFLLFIMLPIFSNVFALLAQIVSKEVKYTDKKIDKKAIIKDQTQILKVADITAQKQEKARRKKFLDQQKEKIEKLEQEKKELLKKSKISNNSKQ